MHILSKRTLTEHFATIGIVYKQCQCCKGAWRHDADCRSPDISSYAVLAPKMQQHTLQ